MRRKKVMGVMPSKETQNSVENFRFADCCQVCRHSKTFEEVIGVRETRCTQTGNCVPETCICDDFDK